MTIDFHSFWTWFLLFTRFNGVFSAIPGIGTDEIPITFRVPLIIVIAFALVVSGAHAEYPSSLAEGGLMLAVEFILGYLLGSLPTLIVAGVSLAGQVSATSIGLNQASVIDPSLGDQVTTLSRIQGLIATAIFLAVDGHHAVLKAAANVTTDVGLGLFRPGEGVFMILLERFTNTFELALSVAAPVMVVSLILQFVLGLLTRFVPQINVFIMSMPLTILVGLFVFVFTLPEMVSHVQKEYDTLEETAAMIMQSK